MGATFMNTENRKTNESHKFVCDCSQKVDLRSSNTHVALRELSIYYTWKNIRKQCKNNKLKILAPTWNDEFELLDGSYSVSDIQDYIEYIIKNINHKQQFLRLMFVSIELIIDQGLK